MLTYDHDRAREAVQKLVDCTYFIQQVRRLRALLKRPRALPFKGDMETLNELVLIGRQNQQALENLIELANFKRDRRASYQREFMARKRVRDRKFIAFEEAVAERKLSLDEKKDALLRQYQIWHRERDAMLKHLGEASWHERNARLAEFWEQKELEIERLTEEAKRTVKRKRVVVPEKKPTALREAMTRAVDKRRGKK